jgi:hypothetical protein
VVHVRSALLGAPLILLAAVSFTGPSGAANGPITSQTGWKTVRTLARGVVEQRDTISVSGYGPRELTRISWTIGNSHVSLDATAVVPRGYTPTNHSLAEGRISSYGASVNALAGINGDTFCQSCAGNGNDLLHGMLVHNRRLYTFGSGPEVGYTPRGGMIMGSARPVPVQLLMADGAATIARWNSLTLPNGNAIGRDQVAVFTHRHAQVSIPAKDVAVALSGAPVAVRGTSTTTHAILTNLLRAAYPYSDIHDRIAGTTTHATEWVDAYRVSQHNGTPTIARLPVLGSTVSGGVITVPTNGAVLVARAGGNAATVFSSVVLAGYIRIHLDDAGWQTATAIMDGKYQMVSRGVAHTRYPGWPDSWPWYCQNAPRGCVRAAVATTSTQGWLVVVSGPSGQGLNMPDFARVLKQLGAHNAMGFDSNTHADFWQKGAPPITASGEPTVPAASMLYYH